MNIKENISSNTDIQHKTKFCMYCGDKIAFDAIICPKCGRQVAQLKIEQDNKKEDMPVIINNNNNNNNIITTTRIPRHYSILFDLLMICLTDGLWIIWMIARPKYY